MPGRGVRALATSACFSADLGGEACADLFAEFLGDVVTNTGGNADDDGANAKVLSNSENLRRASIRAMSATSINHDDRNDVGMSHDDFNARVYIFLSDMLARVTIRRYKRVEKKTKNK